MVFSEIAIPWPFKGEHLKHKSEELKCSYNQAYHSELSVTCFFREVEIAHYIAFLTAR